MTDETKKEAPSTVEGAKVIQGVFSPGPYTVAGLGVGPPPAGDCFTSSGAEDSASSARSNSLTKTPSPPMPLIGTLVATSPRVEIVWVVTVSPKRSMCPTTHAVCVRARALPRVPTRTPSVEFMQELRWRLTINARRGTIGLGGRGCEHTSGPSC